MEPIIIAIVVGLFGSGGFVTFYKARADYRLKKASSELGADENLMTRQDKMILDLQVEARSDDKYITLLINELIRNGISVPERKD